MRLYRLLIPPFPSLLLPFLRLASAASGLPALSDTAGANAPASASKTAAASKTAKGTQSASASASGAKGTTLPALSSTSASGTNLGGLKTDVPKNPGDAYPAPSVPPTANAPFMQKSNLPKGTVFICVGAVLALIALIILAWRGIVAWSLHRSVRRTASKYTYIGDAKSSSGPSHLGSKLASPFAGSTLTLDQLAPSSTGKGPRTSTAPASRNSLFFSPTAAGAGNLAPNSNRASAYLPAGYYASNAPGQRPDSISMSNLAPAPLRSSRTRSVEPSPPPSSRGQRPGTGYLSVSGLGTGLNLSTEALAGAGGGGGGGSEGRAPSAYLEDLFESGANAGVEPSSGAVTESPKQVLGKEEGSRPHTRDGKGDESRRRERRISRGAREEGTGEESSRRHRRRSSHGTSGGRRESTHGLESTGRRRESTHGPESSGRRRDSRTAESPQHRTSRVEVEVRRTRRSSGFR